MKYCATDSKATFEVFARLLEIFLERFQHPATLAGMLEMGTMYLPVNKNWKKYIQSCDTAFNDSENVLKKLLERSANEACKFINQFEYDPWLTQLDWTSKKFTIKTPNNIGSLNSNFLKIIKHDFSKNVFYKISTLKLKNEIDTDFKDLYIDNKTKEAFNTSAFIPKNIPFLCGYPNWYRDLCSRFTEANWQPGPSLISTKTRSTPYLLRLTWNGNPMNYSKKSAWGYLVEKKSFTEPESDKKNKKKTQLSEVKLGKTSYVFQKIPHKNGEKFNVGNPLAKSFLSKINQGVISSIPEKAAGLALKIHTQISYWEMNQKRIRDQKAIFYNDTGAILPISVVSGTVTRRAVEPTWLTATNYSKDRIGSELKAMIQSPDGYYLVGADVDSQELWIAATLGDSEYKIHGSTPLGWMNLQGKKSDGSDMHSKTASIIGISRDQAKVFNYGRIYGAGKKFTQKLLMQFNPNMSEKEAQIKSSKLYSETKGNRNKHRKKYKDEMLIKQLNEMSNDSDEDVNAGKWSGGTESDMFNKLEEIAVSQKPKTPVLEARISQALEPDVVDKNFITSRINWVVQSSAVDYLHIMLVCMNWLIEKYDIEARFSISIHDEVRYIVKENDKHRAALALQLTNLYTRAIFSYKMGFDDLPMSVAFFSGVDIDKCLRKEPDLDFVSPSNPNGLKHGYGIEFGECLDINQILDFTKGKLTKNPL
ncbi:DNA polymerase subunit gamma-1 [Brachionus plicatilis]|uniref:Mitochondrial DNA polymerase catalytic subunit n=1 Tax=Brachionus plicatilis TaxID=10195 RepID=A0A3M7PT58_BRAPC|nr:DNA polymerase subunit gamma-1 [Brachionus plicatilis]